MLPAGKSYGYKSLMQFNHPEQHSPKQLAALDQMVRKGTSNLHQTLFLLTQLATQGLDSFPVIYRHTTNTFDSPGVREYCDRHNKTWKVIRNIPGFKKNLANTKLSSSLYQLDNFYYKEGSKARDCLIILFTTIYNNFHISNVALYSMLKNTGASFLIIKDSTLYRYLNGIKGYGETYQQAISNIGKEIEERGFSKVVITGYSSSSYASLLASTLLKCDQYYGFAIESDYSIESTLDISQTFSEEIRPQLPSPLLANLREKIRANNSTKYELYYGEQSDKDKAHTLNIGEADHIEIHGISNAGHIVLSPLLNDGRFIDIFSSAVQ